MSIRTQTTPFPTKSLLVTLVCFIVAWPPLLEDVWACSPSYSHIKVEWPRYTAPIHTPIWLTVAYLDKTANGLGTFYLRDELGQNVDIEVDRFPGSHGYPSSDFVQLTPKAPLEPDKTYKVLGLSEDESKLLSKVREFKTENIQEIHPLPRLSLQSIEAFELEDGPCLPAFWRESYVMRLEPFETDYPAVKYKVDIDFNDGSRRAVYGVLDLQNPFAVISVQTNKTPSCLTLHITDVASHTVSLPRECALPEPQKSGDPQTACATLMSKQGAPGESILLGVLCLLALVVRRGGGGAHGIDTTTR